MALFRVSRGGKALLLALSVLFQGRFALSLDQQALSGIFDTGAGGGPLIHFAPKISGRPPVVALPAAAADSAVAFKDLRIPTPLFSRESRISPTLVSIIDKARETIDLALYTINLPDVTEALIRAKRRGVSVRVLVDRSIAFPPATASPRPKELDLLVRRGVSVRALRGGIMHNKFGLYDEELLSSGSFNWTVLANTRHFENVVFRDDPDFLVGFQDYFNWMWMQATPLSRHAEGDDYPDPSDGSDPAFRFNGRLWPSFSFSPKGGTEELIIQAIDRCRKSLDIAMFSFFSESIAEAVVRAKERGVSVRVIMDKGNPRNFARARGVKGNGVVNKAKRVLRKGGVDLKFSFGADGPEGFGVLHHKFAVLDGKMVQTGSFNYSMNADASNYENVIFSAAPPEVRAFSREFEFLYSQAGGPTFFLGEESAEAEAAVD